MGDVVYMPLSIQARIRDAIQALPTLTEKEIPLDETCPICLNTFSSIVEAQHTETESAPHDQLELAGVTKLEGCGHIFCRLDVIEWIRGRHGTCPACRHMFLDIEPPPEMEYDSSDGDYEPEDDDEEEEEDGFMDVEDGFTDVEDEFELNENISMDYNGEDIQRAEELLFPTVFHWAAHVSTPPQDTQDVYMEDENMGLSDGDGDASDMSEVEGLVSEEEVSRIEEVEVVDGGRSSSEPEAAVEPEASK